MMQPELLHLSMMILVKHVTMFQKYFLDKYIRRDNTRV